MRKFYFPDTTVGAKLTLDANDGIKSMKDFKKEIQDARGDLVAMTEKFGETSKEALSAAKRVAELTDAMGDAKNLADAFNPDQKFRALSQSLNGVLGGFTAITGAMGLLGVESEGVQKQLLKVQSALALSQGLNQVGDAISSFKTLGKQLLETFGKSGLIGGAVIAGITAIILAIKNTKSEAEELEETTRKQYEASKKVVEGFDLEERKLRALGVAEQDIIDKKKVNIKTTILKAQAELKALDAVLNATLKSASKAAAIRATPGGSIIADLFFSDNEDVGKVQENINKVRGDIEEFNVLLLELDKKQQELNKPKVTGSQTSKGGDFKNPLTRDNEKIPLEEKFPEIKDLKEVGQIKKSLIDEELTKDRLRTEEEQRNAKARADFAKWEADSKIAAAESVGGALGALSDLVGRQTAAGKALGIAQATINTWIGVTEVLRNKTALLEPFGTIQKIASVATIIASGLTAVKNIVKTPVPGYGGGGSAPSFATSAPIQPQLGFTNTRLDRNQLNQIGNATVRAFVVETDVTNNQERVRRLNRAARI